MNEDLKNSFHDVMVILAILAILCGGLATSGCKTLDEKVFAKAEKWQKEFLSGQVETPTEPTTTNTQPTPPPAPISTDEAEKQEGFALTATIAHEIKLTYVNRSGIKVSGGATPNWKLSEDKECYGECHAYVKRDGQWLGGKFDHQRVKNELRPYQTHIYGRYNDKGEMVDPPYGKWKSLQPPKSGERGAFTVVSYDGKWRANAVFFDWP
jgi:hypothetical protein